MLMGIPVVHEANSIEHVLLNFMKASKTSINQGKSQLFFFNTHIAIQNKISKILC
jgi:hypothetical protein